MIRAVFFDLGKVLLDFDYNRAFQRMVERSDAGADGIIRWFGEKSHVHDYERGRLTTQEFYDHVRAELGFHGDFDTFRWVWSDMFWEMPETIAIARALKGRVSLGLLSNTNEMHIAWVAEKFNLLPIFDHVTYSHLEGIGKPDPGIYQRALARAGVQPAEAFFTDDRADNVEGALRAGMDAVQFTDAAALSAALAKRGVLV